MYIESLSTDNFRCFEHVEVRFQYPGRRHGSTRAPQLPNVNLLLGDNGTGKTAILKAIALAVLGEIVQSQGLRPYYLVRRTGTQNYNGSATNGINARVQAMLRLHTEDNPFTDKWNTSIYISYPPAFKLLAMLCTPVYYKSGSC